MKGLRIRPAEERDVAAMLAILEADWALHERLEPELFARGPRWRQRVREGLRESLSSAGDGDEALFVAEHGVEVLGWIRVERHAMPDLYAEPRGYGLIAEASVAPGWRRRGVGAALVDRGLAWFRDRGLDRVKVGCILANELSTSFWRKMGFRPYYEMLDRTLD